MPSLWQWLCASLLFACLASFGWAMQKFFVQPSGTTPGMKVIKYCGLATSVLHFGCILYRHTVSPLQESAAVLLYICALSLFWWAIRTNRNQPLSAVFSSDLPVHLVQHGPYQWIRHPFYTSYLLTWIAGVPAGGQIWLVLTVLVMAALYWRASGMEERKFLSSPLAAAYVSYREQTGRFIPNFFALFRTPKSNSHAESR